MMSEYVVYGAAGSGSVPVEAALTLLGEPYRVVERVVWADKAARSPGAHVLILLIAVIAHALNNNRHRAAAWCAQVRSRRPDLTQAHFFSSFPFRDGTLRRRMSKALSEYGF